MNSCLPPIFFLKNNVLETQSIHQDRLRVILLTEMRALFHNVCGSVFYPSHFILFAFALFNRSSKQKYLKQIHIDSCQIVPNKNPYVAGRRLRNFIEVCRYLEKLSLKNVEYRVDDLLDAFPFLENLR